MKVKKFGGTSLGDLSRIRAVAERIAESHHKGGEPTTVVVSAMAGTTNTLVKLAQDVAPLFPYGLENDTVIAVGEQITAGLLTIALQNLGVAASSWMGWQVPLLVTEDPGKGDILRIEVKPLLAQMEGRTIPVVAGFQGVTPGGRLNTLGRGGSDTTAVAIAAFLSAETCEIFTDVDGVYTANPSYIPKAKPYPSVSYDDMIFLAEHGAKILDERAVRWGKKSGIPIHVLSSFIRENVGTWVKHGSSPIYGLVEKKVSLWSLPSMTPGDVQRLHEQFNSYHLKLLDWHVGTNVRFIISSDTDLLMSGFIPCNAVKEEMTLITFVGTFPVRWIQHLQAKGIPLEKYLSFSKGVSLMVKPVYTLPALEILHELLWETYPMEEELRTVSETLTLVEKDKYSF